MALEIQFLAWNMHKKVAGLKQNVKMIGVASNYMYYYETILNSYKKNSVFFK